MSGELHGPAALPFIHFVENLLASSGRVDPRENERDRTGLRFWKINRTVSFHLTFWRRNYFFNFSTPCI